MERKPQPLIEIRLYGHLRKQFGRSFNMAVRSAADALHALSIVLPGFRQYLAENSSPGFRVWLTDSPVKDAKELTYPPGKLIRIVPVTVGAGGGGIGQIFSGAALIGFAYFTGGIGVGLIDAYAAGGVLEAAGSIAFSIGVSDVLKSYSGELVIE